MMKNSGPARLITVWQRAAWMLLIVTFCVSLATVSACGDDDSPLTFEDGLTAEDILDRASEVNVAQADMDGHVRVTKGDEVTEVTRVGEDTYVVRFSGDEPRRETLHYRGQGWVRESGDGTWEREPRLDSLLGADQPLMGDVDIDSWSGEATRLADETLDGQAVFRVFIEIGGPIEDFQEEAKEIAERLGVDDPPEFPSELTPEEVSATIDLWITTGAFETIQVRMRTMAFVEGAELFDSEKTIELLEAGSSVGLPTPLPY